MSPDWLKSIPGVWKALVVISTALALAFGVGVAVAGFSGLPETVQENTRVMRQNTEKIQDVDEKLETYAQTWNKKLDSLICMQKAERDELAYEDCI